MQIRNEWKQPVSEKQLYLTLVAVILLFGAMGIVFFQTGHVPRLSPIVIGIILFVSWAVVFVDLLRYGRRALPLLRLPLLIGVTLLLGGDLLPVNVSAIAWIKNIGSLMIIGGYLTSVFTVRKPQQQPGQTGSLNQ